MSAIIQHGIYHVPIMLLTTAALAVLCRLVLSFFAASSNGNLLWKATEPLVRGMRFITPADIPDNLVLVFCVLWMVLLRVAFQLTFSMLGLTPTFGAAA